MKKLFTLGFSLLLTAFVFGQHINYENSSKWFWGANIGGAWNTTDVTNKTNVGWGFVFGRSFNYDYGRRASFDWRLRYLRGYWYGQDLDSTGLNNLGANYNGAYKTYKDSLGYTIQNFQADVHELGFELVLHANRLRERSGWDPYIFGGANIVWNTSFGDLYDMDSSIYAYNPSGSTKSILSSLMDGVYDTPLDGSIKDYSVEFMPSLGFGIGYRVAPRVTIGLEHKTTFTLRDNFDGFVDPTLRWGMFKNDIYHYSGGYLTWHFKGGNIKTDIDNPDPDHNTFTNGCQGPVIKLVNPLTANSEVREQSYLLKAEIKQIAGKENITLKVNGVETTNFNYNAATFMLESFLMLNPGANTIEIIASNACERKSQTISINYVNCVPPVVTFTNPQQTGYHVNNRQFVAKATIADANSVTFSVNGQQSTNFFYNTANGSFESNVTLVEGSNTLVITAVNECGTTSQTTSVVLTSCVDPFIDFLLGNQTTVNVLSPQYVLKAKVSNVPNRNNITFRVNGMNQNFVYNQTSGNLESNLTLRQGSNVIEITATNECGTVSKTITINYNPCTAPVVQILSPQAGQVSSNTQAVRVKVEHITSASQIQVFVNGVSTNAFNYNNTTHILEFNSQLTVGQNTIKITVTNDCGTKSESLTVTYAPCVQPVITLTSPASNTLIGTQTITANVQNISNVNQIQLTVNGIIQSGGTYNAFSDVYTTTALFRKGTNTVQITATNECGSITETFTINANTCDAPIISVLAPVLAETFDSSALIKVNVQNISNANQIQILVNGTMVSGVSYNGTSHTASVTANLNVGSNIIKVIATNECGTETKVINIARNECLSPTILLKAPSSSTGVGTQELVVLLQQINNVNQIQVLLNGIPQTGLSYNAATGILSGNVLLRRGENTIKIIATNPCGSITEIYTITANSCDAPVITIPAPVVSETFDVSTVVKVNVQNITNANQLQILVNGAASNGVSFNGTSHIATVTVNLNVGNNVIKVIATNECGTETKVITIHRKEVPVEEEKKITICHYPPGNTGNPQTIEIPLSAWPAHQAHGDKLGPCPETDEPPVEEEKKITICHYPPGNTGNPQTIEIPLSAWPAHQAHGDKLGPCPETDEPPVEEEKKITICHYPPGNTGNPQTIEIPLSAWPAHQAHGDKLGPCPETENNGNGSNNGNSGGNTENVGNENNVGGGNTGDRKITICHYPPGNTGNPQTIEIPLSAWPAHQAHGDKLGPCPESENNDSGNGSDNGSNNGNGSNGSNGNSGGTSGTESGTSGTNGSSTSGSTSTSTGTVSTENGLGNIGSGTSGTNTGSTEGTTNTNTGSETESGSGSSGNSGGSNSENSGKGGKNDGAGNSTGHGKSNSSVQNNNSQSELANKAQEEATRKAQMEAQRRAQEEAMRKAQEEAARKAQEESARKAQEEATRKAQMEAQRKAQEEAVRKAQEEAAHKAKIEAEKKAQEEAARKVQEEAEKKAKEEADKKAEPENKNSPSITGGKGQN